MELSLIIPVFNALEDVKKCLESVKKNFNRDNIEIIIIDDCSESPTRDYLINLHKNTYI